MQESPQRSFGRPVWLMVGAAVAGAVAWGAISHLSGYEIGWLAWGIGLLVGASAVLGGGRGQTIAVTAGVLALLSIAGGRLAGIELARMQGLGELESIGPSEQEFARDLAAARALNEMSAEPTTPEIRQFLVAHGMTTAAEPDRVTNAEVEEFNRETLPHLRGMSTLPADTSHAEFVQRLQSQVREVFDAQFDRLEILQATLSPIDLLFILLGVTTAFGMVMKRTQQEEQAAAAHARAERRAARATPEDTQQP